MTEKERSEQDAREALDAQMRAEPEPEPRMFWLECQKCGYRWRRKLRREPGWVQCGACNAEMSIRSHERAIEALKVQVFKLRGAQRRAERKRAGL